MKICASYSTWRDGQTDMKVTVTLGNFANMSNWLLKHRPKLCIIITEAPPLLTYISQKEL